MMRLEMLEKGNPGSILGSWILKDHAQLAIGGVMLKVVLVMMLGIGNAPRCIEISRMRMDDSSMSLCYVEQQFASTPVRCGMLLMCNGYKMTQGNRSTVSTSSISEDS
jgi:hypothetical protein